MRPSSFVELVRRSFSTRGHRTGDRGRVQELPSRRRPPTSENSKDLKKSITFCRAAFPDSPITTFLQRTSTASFMYGANHAAPRHSNRRVMPVAATIIAPYPVHTRKHPSPRPRAKPPALKASTFEKRGSRGVTRPTERLPTSEAGLMTRPMEIPFCSAPRTHSSRRKL